MSMSTLEKILFLKSAPLFELFYSEELLEVAQIARQVEFKAGDILVEEDKPGECLYIIVNGEADATMSYVGQVTQLGTRDVIGDIAIVSDVPHRATYTAKTDLTTLKIDRSEFWELMTEEPRVAFGIIKVLVQHLNSVIEKMQIQQPSRRGVTNVPLDLWEALDALAEDENDK